MMETVLFIASLLGGVVLIAYSAYMARLKGRGLDSLSETAYIAKKPRTFTIAMAVGAFLVTPRMIAVSGGWSGFLGMAFWVGMAMVGASPHYKKHEHTLHFIGAFTAAISSQLLIAMHEPWLLFLWAFYAVYLINKCRRQVFYEEVVCFVTIMLYNIFG